MYLRNELVQALMEVDSLAPVRVTNVNNVLIWYQVMHRFTVLLDSDNIYGLFVRSVDAHRNSFPWLPDAQQGDLGYQLFVAFERAIRNQSFREADLATRALLGTYIDFLIDSVGETLTVQCICSIASKRRFPRT
jgi:hypothetical protein